MERLLYTRDSLSQLQITQKKASSFMKKQKICALLTRRITNTAVVELKKSLRNKASNTTPQLMSWRITLSELISTQITGQLWEKLRTWMIPKTCLELLTLSTQLKFWSLNSIESKKRSKQVRNIRALLSFMQLIKLVEGWLLKRLNKKRKWHLQLLSNFDPS